MLIVISEKNPSTLLVKKVKASDVVNYLQPPQPSTTTSTLLAPAANPHKANLDAMGIMQVFARSDLTEQDYKQYLDSTPPGKSVDSNGEIECLRRLPRSDGVRLGTGEERESETSITSSGSSRWRER